MKWLFGLPEPRTLLWAVLLSCGLVWATSAEGAAPVGRQDEVVLDGPPMPYVPGRLTMTMDLSGPEAYLITWAYSNNLKTWKSVEHWLYIESSGTLTLFLCQLPCMAMNIKIEKVPPAKQ